MVELFVGVLLVAASFGGLWYSLPVGGQIRPFARDGRDIWIAIAVASGVGLGIAFIIAGATSAG
jgi:hypothetical protein